MTQYLTPEEAQQLGVVPPVGPAPAESAAPSPPPSAPSSQACRPAWQRITEDTLLCRGPALFWGAVLSDDAAITVTFYDGVNTSGRRIFGLLTSAAVQVTVPVFFPAPILLEDGLYVDVSAAPDDLCVLYAPLPG